MNRAANIFLLRVLNRIMRSERLADSDEGFPFIAHEMRFWFDLLLEDSFGLAYREIVYDRGARIPRGCADNNGARPLRHRQYGSLRSSRLTLAAASWRRSIGLLLWPSAEIELVDFDRAAERRLARQHQPQVVTHPPSRWPTYADRLGQPHRGEAFVRLQDQPQSLEPRAMRESG